MHYSVFVPTRLTPEMATQLRNVAAEFEISESAVLRLAVKRFLESHSANLRKSDSGRNRTARESVQPSEGGIE